MQPDHHRQFVVALAGWRPDVDEQAVFVKVLGCGGDHFIDVAIERCGLPATGAECARAARLSPVAYGLWCAPTQWADRWCGVGDAFETEDAVAIACGASYCA